MATNDDLWTEFLLDRSRLADVHRAAEIATEYIGDGAEGWEIHKAAQWFSSIARAVKKIAASTPI